MTLARLKLKAYGPSVQTSTKAKAGSRRPAPGPVSKSNIVNTLILRHETTSWTIPEDGHSPHFESYDKSVRSCLDFGSTFLWGGPGYRSTGHSFDPLGQEPDPAGQANIPINRTYFSVRAPPSISLITSYFPNFRPAPSPKAGLNSDEVPINRTYFSPRRLFHRRSVAPIPVDFFPDATIQPLTRFVCT